MRGGGGGRQVSTNRKCAWEPVLQENVPALLKIELVLLGKASEKNVDLVKGEVCEFWLFVGILRLWCF